MDLTIILPTLNEEKNIAIILPRLIRTAAALSIQYEILLIDGGSKDQSLEIASGYAPSVKILRQTKQGFAEAIKLGIKTAQGEFIITLDADLSHEPEFIKTLWGQRHMADLVIASRFIPGGRCEMPFWRWLCSITLSWFLGLLYKLPYRDVSSGFRIYKSQVFKSISLMSIHFEVLQEILLKAHHNHFKITETPMHYHRRLSGRSKFNPIRFAIPWLRVLVKQI